MPPFAATRRRLGASPRFVRHKPSCRRFNKIDKKCEKRLRNVCIFGKCRYLCTRNYNKTPTNVALCCPVKGFFKQQKLSVEKFLQKVLLRFGWFKNSIYLCTTFRDKQAASPKNGSLIYWLYFERM